MQCSPTDRLPAQWDGVLMLPSVRTLQRHIAEAPLVVGFDQARVDTVARRFQQKQGFHDIMHFHDKTQELVGQLLTKL